MRSFVNEEGGVPPPPCLQALTIRSAVTIQRHFRGWLARFRYRRLRAAAVTLQSFYRRQVALRKLEELRKRRGSVGNAVKLGVGMEQKVVELQRRIQQQDRSYKALQDETARLQKELRDRDRDEGRRVKILQDEIGRLRKRQEELRQKETLQRGAGAAKAADEKLVMGQLLGSAPRWPHSDQHMDREDLIEAYYGMVETNRLLESQLQEQRLEHEAQMEAMREELQEARKELEEALHGTTLQTEAPQGTKGMLDYDPINETLLIRRLITELDPTKMAAALPCLPAYILFLCIRRADDVNDARRMQSLLGAAIKGIKTVLQDQADFFLTSFWLANSCRLLHCLKQYSGDPGFMSQNTPQQNEQCLKNFDLTEYREVLTDLCRNIYGQLYGVAARTLQPMLVSALLESQTLWGLKSLAYRTPPSNMAEEPKPYNLQNLIGQLEGFYRIVTEHALDPELILQFYRQLFYRIAAFTLNHLLLRKELCSWPTGLQLRYNISQLEEWLHSRKLQHSGALEVLQPLIQAAQLLQLNKKSQRDAQAICNHCNALSCQQIVKLLTLYTPLDDFEERVTVAFIRTIQTSLQDGADPNQLLLDTSLTFPIRIPYNPSSVPLAAIRIPPSLHLHFLLRL